MVSVEILNYLYRKGQNRFFSIFLDFRKYLRNGSKVSIKK